MTIKSKDLHQWIKEKTPIRYKGEMFRAWYDGSKYFLAEFPNRDGGAIIPFYKKSRGVWGLTTNK